jgi:hypothetical protein
MHEKFFRLMKAGWNPNCSRIASGVVEQGKRWQPSQRAVRGRIRIFLGPPAAKFIVGHALAGLKPET